MLKQIPSIISPDLLKILHEMGHGDEVVLGDGNFPAASHANRLIRCDGHDIPGLLDAIMQLLPVDTYVEQPIHLMQVVEGDSTPVPMIWKDYEEILGNYQVSRDQIGFVERFAFYERAKKAHAIVATSEQALYANIILKKGVIS
ncbi:fucose isomerase [Gracilibacillus caseinilyticus]|uniref:Fucose isomerase n=1 Tax=Gracilibacillus caseinilyticus TaxID=2932256 RepID=A0ABY4EZX3_9BACI|nr:RbsD/FucU domain-containing protein [Gracilibacillus caseinilyticus]UOQ49959.1 fucose isomerase [Gracilibacillus caseinilyticus]